MYAKIKEIIKNRVEKADLKELKKYVKCLFISMRNIHESDPESSNKPMFLEAEIEPLCKEMNKILLLVEQDKIQNYKILTAKKGFNFDDEDMEMIKAELQKITKIASFVMEFSGQLVQNYKASVADLVKNNFQQFYAKGLANYNQLTTDELTDCLCFFTDLVEHSY
jgi:hypothetical protein